MKELLQKIEKRIEETYELQDEKNKKLSDENFAISEPDTYREIENEANILEGELKALYWVKREIETSH